MQTPPSQCNTYFPVWALGFFREIFVKHSSFPINTRELRRTLREHSGSLRSAFGVIRISISSYLNKLVGFHTSNMTNDIKFCSGKKQSAQRTKKKSQRAVTSDKNQPSFWICVCGQENHMNIVRPSFWKSFVFEMISGHTHKKILRFAKRFRKAPFSWRINVDGRPNCRNKATF